MPICPARSTCISIATCRVPITATQRTPSIAGSSPASPQDWASSASMRIPSSSPTIRETERTRPACGGSRAGSAFATSRCSTVASRRGARPDCRSNKPCRHARPKTLAVSLDSDAWVSSEEVDELRQRPGHLLVDARGARALCRAQRDHRSDRRPRAGREKPSFPRQSRRRRKIPARRGAARAIHHPARIGAGVFADLDVRLGSHRLPQPARARTRRPYGCASVCRFVERMDSRSAPAGRHRPVLVTRSY